MTDEEIYKAIKIKPACDGMGRSEVTSLLSRELVRLRLTRRNAYSYWAHEVEVWDEVKQKQVRVDFMSFEPHGCHTSTDCGSVERGTFACYEVKSCLEDVKSGCGLNFLGDEGYMVMPVEAYAGFWEAYHGTNEGHYMDYDKRLRECLPSIAGVHFLLYGIGRNGYATFKEVTPSLVRGLGRRKSASELLFCMMRAMLANSDHSDVDHEIERYGGEA